ncbi:hypothetical protein B0H16DRAFT_1222229, partial [Mycena metata]
APPNDLPVPNAGSASSVPRPDHLPLSLPEPRFEMRSSRHCLKCGSAGCKGKEGHIFCPSACMDCEQVTCRGRNSRRPDKRCD